METIQYMCVPTFTFIHGKFEELEVIIKKIA